MMDLHARGLTTLPPEIGDLTALEFLHLRDNSLTSLPAEIGLLHSLEWLELSENNLVNLPADIGELDSLRDLNVSGNSLTTLPAAIGNLSSLMNLDLSTNALISLPESVTDLGPLRLEICYNHLTAVSDPVATWLDSYAELNWGDCQTPVGRTGNSFDVCNQSQFPVTLTFRGDQYYLAPTECDTIANVPNGTYMYGTVIHATSSTPPQLGGGLSGEITFENWYTQASLVYESKDTTPAAGQTVTTVYADLTISGIIIVRLAVSDPDPGTPQTPIP